LPVSASPEPVVLAVLSFPARRASDLPSPPTDGNVHIHGGTAGPTRVDGWSGTRADGRSGARVGGGVDRWTDGRGQGAAAGSRPRGSGAQCVRSGRVERRTTSRGGRGRGASQDGPSPSSRDTR